MGLTLRRSPELLEGGHHELLDVRFLNDIGIQKALEVEAQNRRAVRSAGRGPPEPRQNSPVGGRQR